MDRGCIPACCTCILHIAVPAGATPPYTLALSPLPAQASPAPLAAARQDKKGSNRECSWLAAQPACLHLPHCTSSNSIRAPVPPRSPHVALPLAASAAHQRVTLLLRRYRLQGRAALAAAGACKAHGAAIARACWARLRLLLRDGQRRGSGSVGPVAIRPYATGSPTNGCSAGPARAQRRLADQKLACEKPIFSAATLAVATALPTITSCRMDGSATALQATDRAAAVLVQAAGTRGRTAGVAAGVAAARQPAGCAVPGCTCMLAMLCGERSAALSVSVWGSCVPAALERLGVGFGAFPCKCS